MSSGALNTDIGVDENVRVGEDRTIQFNVKQSDGTTAQTMTTWALRFDIKRSLRDTTALVSKTTGSGITIGDGSGTDDRATVTLLAADTVTLGAGTFVYGLARTDAGSETVLAEGKFVVRGAPVL